MRGETTRGRTEMAIVKCPHCHRRFAGLVQSRDHIQDVHPDGGLP